MGTKNNPGKFDCYAAAEPDEPMFTLLGRDPLASVLVRLWADWRMSLGTINYEKVREADSCADTMLAWAEKLGKSVPERSDLMSHLQKKLEAALASSPSQPAVRDVIAERQRQVSAEGWTPEHDDEHSGGDLARAAACYALGKDVVTNLGGERVSIWPWEGDGWKPKDSRRNLVRAGALILAEIERLDRAAAPALVEGKK